MRIVWTALAIRDLGSARAHIAHDNPPAADKQVEIVVTTVAGLARFPETGRPGRRAGTRELVVGRTPYLVAYRVRGDVIDVLRVLHGRQKWPEAF